MTNDKNYPPPEADDQEALRDAFWDLEFTGHTTIARVFDPQQFIYWLERYRGIDRVKVEETNRFAHILVKD